MLRFIASSLAIALACAVGGTATAATPISVHGHTGQYVITDTVAHPEAVCRYDSGAGSHYLALIHARVIAMYGLNHHLQQVGYRLLLQQRKPTGWTTIAHGPLRTALVEVDVPNGLAASNVARDPEVAPNAARYRAALRLLWFSNHDGSVVGRVLLRVDHHLRDFNDSVRPACKGQVPTGIGVRVAS